MQRTDYRFTLTRDTDTFEAFPDNFFAGSFKYEQQEGQLFFRRKFEGELIFKGSDFAYIKGRYDLGYYCDVYEILIEKKVNGVFQSDWSGYFSITDGSFDFERCRFSVTPTVEDKYSCIDLNKSEEINILKIAATDIGSYVKSVLEFELQYSSSTTPPSTTNVGMVYMTYRLRSSSPLSYVHVFAREAIVLEKSLTPSGSGWTEITDQGEANVIKLLDFNEEFKKWGRSWVTAGVSAPGTDDLLVTYDVVNSDCTVTETTPASLGYSGNYLKIMTGRYRCPASIASVSKHSMWIKKTIYDGALFTQSTDYKGRNLVTAIKYVLDQTCGTYGLVSNFLLSSTNTVTGLTSKTNNLFLVQKSDAKRPNASNPATKGFISFESLMSALYNVFQLYWYINDNDEIVIVHQSEIENLTDINLNNYPYTAHKKIVEFNKSLLFRYETWHFMESSGEDFIGLPIEYSEFCTIKDDNAKTKQYRIDNISTDLSYIQTNVTKVNDEGFALIATDGEDVLLESGLLSNSNQLNGHLSTANLHDKYWRHNRILKTGKMNGIDTTFTSSQKIRNLQEQQIVYCDAFDPTKRVVTELGTAIVNEATQYPLDNKLVLNLSI